MKKYDKIFTDNPFIDELLYFTKTIAVNAVIKDSDEADANETVESLKASDLYIACRENKVRFEHFKYSKEFLLDTNLFTLKDVERYDKDNTFILRDLDNYRKAAEESNTTKAWNDYNAFKKKIDKLVELRSNEYIENYNELNDYYRTLAGLPSTADTISDYIYINNEDELLSGVPSLAMMDKSMLYLESSIILENGHYITIDENNVTMLANFEDQENPLYATDYFFELEPKATYIRIPLYKTTIKDPIIITINEEIDDTIGYTNLADPNNYSWKPNSKFNESGKIVKANNSNMIISNYIRYKKGDIIRIKNARFDTDRRFGLYYSGLALHDMDIDDLTILYSHGVIDDLIKEYPDKKYLKFMGDNAIDIYKARKAMNFQTLYIPTVSNNELMDRWNTKYEQNRMYTMKTYYSEAYKLYSDYYNNFIIVFILIQTMIDIISEVQEFIARRDIFDDRSIRYLFESFGIPYYPEIPRVYQIAMVKNINTLLKWKASTKNMIDICSLFGFDEVEIFRYYLLRDRRLVPDYDNNKQNDEYQFHYKTIIDENGEEKVVPDNDKNYELKFVRTPIEEKADDYLKDKTAYEDYDIITEGDPFWDGQSDHQDVKSAILDQEFSWVRTKYISIDTMYDLAQMSFDLPYFINIFVDDWAKNKDGVWNEDYLYVKIPTIKNNHRFRVSDLFVYMMAITHIYHGFEDLIMVDESKILSILGFNFHVDMHELAMDIWENTRMDINEMKADYFYIPNPNKNIVSFDYLLQLFTKNKEIWNTVSEGMFHADNKRVYDAYKKVYDACYIADYTTTFYELDGEPFKKADKPTYTDFLKERDYVLYESIVDLKSYTDEISLRKAISDIIIEIVYVLDDYMDSDEFKYVFSKFPAVSGDYIRSYMLKVVNFFKSYKVHLLDISTVYKAFDKRENSIKIYEDWINETTKEPSDYSQIIEEITADIHLNKTDKIKLLEKVYFDIERWEFKDFDDYFIFDIKQQIQAIMNEMTYQDSVNIIDHYKGYPFAGIEYEYSKIDRVNWIDSIDPEVETNLKSRCNIFENMKIYYED